MELMRFFTSTDWKDRCPGVLNDRLCYFMAVISIETELHEYRRKGQWQRQTIGKILGMLIFSRKNFYKNLYFPIVENLWALNILKNSIL